jgi:D-methionine transport system ATP-binding protein
MPNYSEDHTDTTPQLRVDGVSLKTPIASNYLLENISFQVDRGDRIAIVGPSGAGKTTLLRLLNRLSSPTSGSIYLENTEYRQIPAIELHPSYSRIEAIGNVGARSTRLSIEIARREFIRNWREN